MPRAGPSARRTAGLPGAPPVREDPAVNCPARYPSPPIRAVLLLWGLILDYSLWHVLPDGVTWVGAAIIVLSGLYLLHRERVHMEAERP